jgi:gluconolactonase
MSRQQRLVAAGLRFPEGPSALGDGSFAVVEMQGEAISRVTPGAAPITLGDLGGGPNGSVVGSAGEVYVANNGGLSAQGMGYWHAPRSFDGCVQRVTPDGEVSSVGGPLPGDAPHRPNDLCFAPDGSLLVTDSANWEDMRNLNPGRIVRIEADGRTTGLTELSALPNGIGFGADERLYVAQSLTRRILVFEWNGGQLSDPEPFCRLEPGGMPDGFCFDSNGRIYVCASIGNAVHVYDADGELKETIGTGEGTQPTNCCLYEGSLYVTLAIPGQLVAYELGVETLPLHSGSIETSVAQS